MVALPLSSSVQQDSDTREYVLSIMAGRKPPYQPECGRWTEIVSIIEDAYDRSQQKATVVAALVQSMIHTQKYSGLEELLFGSFDAPSVNGHSLQPLTEGEQPPALLISGFPALPESAQLTVELAAGASPNMDMYIEYSKAVSPEGYEQFHEGGFLSLLSTINARRTKIPFRDKDYCSLMIAFVADSTDYAKTTTVKVVEKVLEAAGLSWFLGAGKTTPQRLVQEMAGIVPKDYLELESAVQERIKLRLAFAGQRGWHAGEMGKMIKSMMNGHSAMADFQGLLLEMDDNKDRYENATISRNTETIEKPYLSILGCMTPPNLQVNAKAGAEFWNDGFWARWAFYCPPDGSNIDCPMELGDYPPPPALVLALRRWHYRLGIPRVEIEPVRDDKDKLTGHFSYTRDAIQEETAIFAEGVWDAWARYRSGLKQLSKNSIPKDLKSSYGRLSVKAMRIATLLASLENNGVIEMRHWAKAQEIVERMRQSLHELYHQVNHAELEPSYAKRVEDDILKYVRKLETEKQPPTVRDLSRYMTRVDVGKIKQGCADLVRAGLLVEEKTGKASRFTTASEVESEADATVELF